MLFVNAGRSPSIEAFATSFAPERSDQRRQELVTGSTPSRANSFGAATRTSRRVAADQAGQNQTKPVGRGDRGQPEHNEITNSQSVAAPMALK